MTATVPAPPRSAPIEPRQIRDAPTTGDRIFQTIVVGGAWASVGILGLILFFLLNKAWPAITDVGVANFLTTFEWLPEAEIPVYGIASVLVGTIIIAIIALAAAVPLAVGAALFVTEYLPPRVARPVTTLIDLLAAVPSLIYGMWGLYWLQPKMNGTSLWLSDHLGFIPIFNTTRPVFGSSMFMAGLIVAAMIIPIIASVAREVFAQVPRVTCEGALALGGTRWGMIRKVVLPFGRSGIVGAAMLGLGRALGETIAVVLVLSINFTVTARILEPGGGSVAALIANQFGEASENGRSALIAAGLALFILTLLVNMGARLVVNRSHALRSVDR